MTKKQMKTYKFEIIKRYDVMQAVLRKANELEYRLRDPRHSFEECWQKNDYMMLTDTGAIVFMSNRERFENESGIDIDFDWFNIEKPIPMAKVTLPRSELGALMEHESLPESCKPQNWKVEAEA